MTTSHTWWFVLLLALCVVGPYIFGVAPRARRQWAVVAITIAFLAWLLLLMAPLRSQ